MSQINVDEVFSVLMEYVELEEKEQTQQHRPVSEGLMGGGLGGSSSSAPSTAGNNYAKKNGKKKSGGGGMVIEEVKVK